MVATAAEVRYPSERCCFLGMSLLEKFGAKDTVITKMRFYGWKTSAKQKLDSLSDKVVKRQLSDYDKKLLKITA